MHYVCSDIHGRWDRYEAMLKGLNLETDDHLYILGDVIDRGQDGIRILLDIKERGNITFFLGNHELFLLTILGTADEEWMDSWFFNGGRKTAEDFTALDQKEQDGILDFLENSYGAMPNLAVDGVHYYLVHAFPDLHYLDKPVLVSELMAGDDERERLYDMVWTRPDRPGFGRRKVLKTVAGMGRKLIIGHTITSYLTDERAEGGKKPKIYHGDDFTCIDCGCAMRGDRGQLGVLRLEDGAEFYF